MPNPATTTRRLTQLLPTAVISIGTDPVDKVFGIIALGGTYPTGLDWGTLENDGGVDVDVYIYATDMTGAGYTWTLADDGVPGNNIYALKAGLEGGSYNKTVKRIGSTPYNVLVASLDPGNSTKWGFTLYAPTAWTEQGNIMTGTITVLAEAA